MRALVTGAGGFIGSHLVKYLKEKGYWVRGVDVKEPEFSKSSADEFIIKDLRYPSIELFENFDEVYHLAADMGGIGYIETHKAEIVFNNTMMNMLTLKACQEQKVGRFLFSSSACVYPGYLQNEAVKWNYPKETPKLKEEDAYPADAEDGYGWEKLMMERVCEHFMEDFGLSVRIARFHNIYGPEGTYEGGREKSIAALCRKVIKATNYVEIWGDGTQTRSYCYIDDCVEAIFKLMQSDYTQPINIGTDRLVNIDKLFRMIMDIENKALWPIYSTLEPIGVLGRNADITKAKEILGWEPKISLEEGLKRTYEWIKTRLS